MSERTFKVDNPPTKGDDVKAWQEWLNEQMAHWRVDYRLKVDGLYQPITRDLTASVVHGLGLASAMSAMAEGVTPELRTKLRNKRLTPDEVRRHNERERNWLPGFRSKHETKLVHTPLDKILSSSWGYHPPVHDGVDLICKPNAVGFAICKAEVIRADNGGWWGKGAPSPTVAAKGDGIVVLRSLVDVGPFKKDLRFCYGHAEHVRVEVGDVVDAGDPICLAGLANAWHFHFMVHDRNDARGVGDRDPMLFVNYAIKNG